MDISLHNKEFGHTPVRQTIKILPVDEESRRFYLRNRCRLPPARPYSKNDLFHNKLIIARPGGHYDPASLVAL